MQTRALQARYTLVAFLAAMVLLHAVFFWQARHLIAQRYPDFTAFYAAGTIVRRGMGHQLYNLDWQAQIEREEAGRPSTVPLLPFLRPAYEALAFAPFSLLPYLAAFGAWNGLSIVLLWVWVRIVRKNCPQLNGFSDAFWWLALFAFFPVFLNFPMGQDSILLALLVTLAFLKLRENAAFGAGIYLGIAMFKPQIVIPLLLILLFRSQRIRLMAGFLGANAALVLVSAVVAGWRAVANYPQYLMEINRGLGSGTITPSDMPNLRGLAAIFGASQIAPFIVGAVSVALIALAGTLWLKVARSSFDFDSAFSISLIVALLVSYHSHIFDLALLIVPIALTLDAILDEDGIRTHAMELAAIAALFFTPLYLVLIRYGLGNFIALPVVWFATSIGISCLSRARANISPSIGM